MTTVAGTANRLGGVVLAGAVFALAASGSNLSVQRMCPAIGDGRPPLGARERVLVVARDLVREQRRGEGPPSLLGVRHRQLRQHAFDE